jgi:hypothetical protein
MGTTWVLDTETKGTGANMVPLERTQRRSPGVEKVSVPRKPKPREPEPPKPKAPHRFRIVDVMTRENIVDDVTVAEAVDALRDVRSTVDVSVYVWQPERERWRRLTFSEQRALFDLAVSS